MDENQFAPSYRYRYTHHNGKARYHASFITKHIIYQTLKIAYSIPATELPDLIPINHFPTSARITRYRSALDLQDGYLPPPIRPIIVPLQRQTWGALSKAHWVYGTAIFPPPPPTRPIIVPFQRETWGSLSKVHRVYRDFCQCLLLTTFRERAIPLENSTHAESNKYR